MIPDGEVNRTDYTLTASGFRASEKIVVAYFVYIALLSSARGLSLGHVAVAWLIPVVVSAITWAAVSYPGRRTNVLRDWLPLPLILVGYWELEWFAAGRLRVWEDTWLAWDRHLLDSWGLRAAIESLGGVIPTALEFCYVCLYVIPMCCLAALYLSGRRDRVDKFLTTLFLGGFTAYALLPLFPVASPRLAFLGADLPHFGMLGRALNLWVLDHFDITTSVFPSGHVAVAFSSTFGLWRALPENRRLAYALLALSTMVYVATIYSRYHYAVDGLAGASIALLAWAASGWVEQHV